MDVLVRYLTRKRTGDVARRDVTVTADIVRLGRGTDCDVYLADPRVPLLHSQIRALAGALQIEVIGPFAELSVNGALTRSAQLKVGDVARIGPFVIAVAAPEAGKSLLLTVELVEPLGDDLAELRSRSRMSLTVFGLSQRGWAWLLSAAAILLCLGLPLFAALTRSQPQTGLRPLDIGDPTRPTANAPNVMRGGSFSWLWSADGLWLSGEISRPHSHFADNCRICHQQPFFPVRDDGCLNCHVEIPHHADPRKFKSATFQAVNCTSCHKEHNGVESIAPTNEALCVSCHADLDRREPNTTLLNVSAFSGNHPEFRPTVVVDAAGPTTARLSLGAATMPKEGSNLKFPHAKHLDPIGVKHPSRGSVVLTCGDCHLPDSGEAGMAAIDMERHCQGCHQLRFEPGASARPLPHGMPREAIAQIREYYGMMALRGELADPTAPDILRLRRLPGTRLSPEERVASLNWASTKAAEVVGEIFGKRLCITCHMVTPPDPDGDGMWSVAPIKLADRWMPKGMFDHSRHKQSGCAHCHAAANSKEAHDILLPKIETCRVCHAGERAANKVPSNCVNCHVFHQTGLPPMKERTQR